MSPNKNQLFIRNAADTDLKFFSAVTASVTHELNNILAIINQTGGLLEDLMYGADETVTLAPEQLKRITERLEKQSSRGIETIKKLNKFAHNCDEVNVAFDLKEITGGIVALSQRFADLCQVKLQFVNEYYNPVKIINNPLKIQQLIFLILREIFKASKKEEVIDVEIDVDDDEVKVIIKHSVTGGSYTPEMDTIDRIAEEVGCPVTVKNVDANQIYRIDFADRL